MIEAKTAVDIARSLIGTPYAEMDCINLIKKVIRDAQGGVKTYTTAGTNTLWRSYDASAKYRDLTWRQTGLSGAQAGMIAFKADGEDFHHAGIVTDVGTVVHSSSTQGGRGVVETPLSSREGWTHLAVHRYIKPMNPAEKEETRMGEKAMVKTEGGALNVREEPDGRVIAQIPNGSEVEILEEAGEWLRIHFGESRSGYVFAAYISRQAAMKKRMRIIDEAGNIYDMEGAFTVQVIEDD